MNSTAVRVDQHVEEAANIEGFSGRTNTLRSWEECWNGPDGGLIACWEAGRAKAVNDPRLAQRARNGELMILPWKGGINRPLKTRKYGSLRYLAMWRGLRGEPLIVDLDSEVILTCSKTGVSGTYTPRSEKYMAA